MIKYAPRCRILTNGIQYGYQCSRQTLWPFGYFAKFSKSGDKNNFISGSECWNAYCCLKFNSIEEAKTEIEYLREQIRLYNSVRVVVCEL